MSRRRRQAKRQVVDDPIYGLKSISKFINALMIGGKKTTAEKIFYNSFSLIKDKSKEDPVKVFNEAIKKREDTHKMAESNKAFAHFRW